MAKSYPRKTPKIDESVVNTALLHATPQYVAATSTNAVAIGSSAVASSAGSIAIGSQSAHSHTISAGTTNQISFGNIQGQPALQFYQPTPYQVTFHKCETCGAMLNAWDPDSVDAHGEWHKRLDPLMRLLASNVGQDAVLKTLKGDLEKLLDGLS